MLAGEEAAASSRSMAWSENAFSESSVNLLTTLANSMSVALENARLFDETQRLLKETEQRAAELAVINSIQEGMAAELDFQAIIDLVGDKLREVFATERHRHPLARCEGQSGSLSCTSTSTASACIRSRGRRPVAPWADVRTRAADRGPIPPTN